MNWLKKNFLGENLPIVLILIAGLVLGLFIFSDFGASWDEPEYYQYADSTMHAYSIRAIIENRYSLESSYGPADLRYYGPSFLLLGKAALPVLNHFLLGAQEIDLWHFWIYIFFLVGGGLFYKLARRWITPKAATVSTLLFISQPVLFGNAWINPKDTPFLVFFLGTVYFGLLFLDTLKLFLSSWEEFQPERVHPITQRRSVPGNLGARYLSVLAGILLLSAVVLTVGANQIKNGISELILAVNRSSPTTTFDQLFTATVRGINDVPLSYYAQKAIVLYDQWLPVIWVAALAISALLLFVRRHPGKLIEIWASIKQSTFRFKDYYRAHPHRLALTLSFLATCYFLASASATRVIGPFAGFLVFVVWIMNFKRKSIPVILLCGLLTFVLFYVQWPYIWHNTFEKFVFVVRHMSNNPIGVNTLLAGNVYDSRDLPITYLPHLLSVTLTEPALFLIPLGIVVLCADALARKPRSRERLLVLAWFFVPLAYILWRRPPMYDNYRHFLFLLPALFLFAAASIQFIFSKVPSKALQNVIGLLILVPGFIGLLQTHPFQYSYYNALVGGVRGASNVYDLDYWLTCYKHLGELIQNNETGPVVLYVDLNPELFSLYRHSKIQVHSIREEPFAIGGLLALPRRWEHSTLFAQYPIAYSIKLQGVDLCVARRVE